MPKKPPCSTDEVVNPRTHFCVKLAGKIGKELAKLKAAAAAKCASGKIINPKTGRCVNIDGKIGKTLVKQEVAKPAKNNTVTKPLADANKSAAKKVVTKPLPVAKKADAVVDGFDAQSFSNHVMFSKSKKKAVIAIRFALARSKTLLVQIDDKHTTTHFTTLQALLKRYTAEVTKLLDNGWKITKVVGNPNDAIEKAIQDMSLCRKEPKPGKLGHLKDTYSTKDECQNQDTLIMFDDILTVPQDKRVKTADGYCFDIEELADSMLASATLNNPLTRQILADEDIKQIVNHIGLDQEKRTRIKNLQMHIIKNRSSLEAVHASDPKLLNTFIQALNIASITCVADYTNDFIPSQNALSRLGDVMSRFKPNDYLIVSRILDKTGSLNLSGVIESTNYGCIHGVGYRLVAIFMNNYVALKSKGSIWLPPLIGLKPLPGDMYVLLYSLTDVSINIYISAAGTFLRLGSAMLERGPPKSFSMFRSDNVWNIDYRRAQAMYNELEPSLQQIAQERDTIIYTTKEVGKIGKVIAKL